MVLVPFTAGFLQRRECLDLYSYVMCIIVTTCLPFIQAQVPLLIVYGRRPPPARSVGIQYGGTSAPGVPLVGMGDRTVWDLSRRRPRSTREHIMTSRAILRALAGWARFYLKGIWEYNVFYVVKSLYLIYSFPRNKQVLGCIIVTSHHLLFLRAVHGDPRAVLVVQYSEILY